MKSLPRLVWNEFAILLRDPAVLFWTFVFPFAFMYMMLFAFGSSGTLPQQVIEVVDLDRSELSRQYLDDVSAAFTQGETIPGDLRSVAADAPIARHASRITIPEGFGEDIRAGLPVAVSVAYAEDGMPQQIVVRVIKVLTLRFESRISGQPETVVVRTDDHEASPTVDYTQYVLTGTMVLAMMSAGMNTICVALAYRRERNGFKMMACMPIPASMFVAGMVLSRLLLLVLAGALFVVLGRWLFGVPIVLDAHKIAGGLLISVLGGATLLALGTLLGARVATASTATFITSMTYIALLFLCDLTMPMNAMSPAVREAMSHLPPALFVHEIRRVFVLGGDLGGHWRASVELVAWLVALLALISITFRWHRR